MLRVDWHQLFCLWRQKMLKTEGNNWKKRKWKLILISSLSTLQPRLHPFSACGNNAVCHLKSVTLFCMMFPQWGCVWGSPRSSLAQPELRDCTAAGSWPVWAGSSWEEQSHPSSHFVGIACWEQPTAVLLSVQPPTWLFLTWISHLDSLHVASCSCQQKRTVKLQSIFSESRLLACRPSPSALCGSIPCMDSVPRSVPGTHFFTCAGSLSHSNVEGFSYFCGAWVQAYTAQHSICRPGITDKLFYPTVHALLVMSASRVRYFPFHEKIMLSIMKFHSVSSYSPQACSTQDKKEFLLVNN